MSHQISQLFLTSCDVIAKSPPPPSSVTRLFVLIISVNEMKSQQLFNFLETFCPLLTFNV